MLEPILALMERNWRRMSNCSIRRDRRFIIMCDIPAASGGFFFDHFQRKGEGLNSSSLEVQAGKV